LPETGCDRDHGRPGLVSHHLELVALAHRRLVNVAGEDELGAGVDKSSKHAVPMRDRAFARGAPRSADQMVVEHGDVERSSRGRGEPLGRPLQLRVAQRAALMAKGPCGVETDDMKVGRGDGRFRGLPDTLELGPWTNEPNRCMRKIMVTRHGEHGRPERAQELGCSFDLLPAPAVREIARSYDELGFEPLDEPCECALDFRLLMCTRVQVGNMEKPRIHDWTRL
jgi:hypothetical protein